MKQARRKGSTGRSTGGRRKASVMILVVALLALLALMGVAWLSTVRSQRLMSQQGVLSTRVDQNLTSAVDAIKGAIIEGIRGRDAGSGNPSTYRRASYGGNTSTYLNADFDGIYWNAPTNAIGLEIAAGNQYLASRVPLVNTAGTIYWPTISAPLVSAKTNTLVVEEAQRFFESPWQPVAGALPLRYQRRASQPSGTVIQPTFVTFNEGSPGGPLHTYPAFIINNVRYLAADTMGSGIADAGLGRLVQIGDITYYVAYRVLDNNSAINLSTAWKPCDTDMSASGPDKTVTPWGNFFPSNINLFSLLTDNGLNTTTFRTVDRQMDALNTFRRGNLNNPSWGTMLNENGGSAGSTSSPYEAMWMQLGRRVDYPGQIASNVFYSAVSAGETGRMASGSVLAPYGDPLQLVNSNQIDSALFETLCLGPTAPYNWPREFAVPDDSHVQRWYYQNFDYSQPGVGYSVYNNQSNKWADNPGFSRRPLLVARNGVSQGVPSVPEQNASYPMAPLGQCPTPGDMPTKASLNTADFNELWRAYFMVMAGDPTAADPNPFVNVAGILPNIDNTLYKGQNFDPAGTPLAGESRYRMFRNGGRANVIAGGTAPLTPGMMVQLRSALAAINTRALRDGSPTYTANNTASVDLTDASGATVYKAQVFGIKPQVFITEVYAENDWVSDPQTKGANPNGYVAFELQNPNTAAVNITGWKIAALDRNTKALTAIHTFANRSVQGRVAGSNTNLIFIENFDEAGTATGKAAKYRPQVIGPSTMTLGDNTKPVYVEKLSDVLGQELVLLRPPPAGAAAALADWIPVDSFDFTTFRTKAKLYLEALPVGSGNWVQNSGPVPTPPFAQLMKTEVTLWHYARNSNNNEPFKCVYPGRYYVSSITADDNAPRQQGTRTYTWNSISYPPPAVPGDPQDPTKITYHGAILGNKAADPLDGGLDTTRAAQTTSHGGPPTVDTSFGDQSVSSYRNSEFTIQWGDFNVPGGTYPYGGFARNLDALDVPFIGAYVIKTPGSATVTEMNAVTMDAVAAEDTDPTDDPTRIGNVTPVTAVKGNFRLGEQIGRFSPVRAVPDAGGVAGLPNDFDANPASNVAWRYRWAMKLPDYLTVQAPWGDHLPDAPTEYGVGAATPNTTGGTAVANQEAERSVAVQGLVSINTAPVPVLATVPFLNWSRSNAAAPPYQQWLLDSQPDERLVPMDDNGTAITLPGTSPIYNRTIYAAGLSNLDIAEYIVYYRDVEDGTGRPHGPFRSIWDLYQVTAPTDMANPRDPTKRYPLFHSLAKAMLVARGTTGPGIGDGYLSPYINYNTPQTQFLLLNRVSNLITTRSDSFTVYIVVQGWRNAGSPNPELVSQQRIGMVVDRSGVTRTKHDPKVSVFPLK